ncbi:hypothetical protein [Cohnella herbarum]|uniref:Uncharacterized protein n=1 Tax=Cohnella herbarum TaxID=2728023 RepID=A0A7Z2ZM14_9BACL|nr:hypothetical protein [Cohnella herbarum]QJD84578.1 hypothetical protein HH215_16260 [Cohnella herbarum]
MKVPLSTNLAIPANLPALADVTRLSRAIHDYMSHPASTQSNLLQRSFLLKRYRSNNHLELKLERLRRFKSSKQLPCEELERLRRFKSSKQLPCEELERLRRFKSSKQLPCEELERLCRFKSSKQLPCEELERLRRFKSSKQLPCEELERLRRYYSGLPKYGEILSLPPNFRLTNHDTN